MQLLPILRLGDLHVPLLWVPGKIYKQNYGKYINRISSAHAQDSEVVYLRERNYDDLLLN